VTINGDRTRGRAGSRYNHTATLKDNVIGETDAADTQNLEPAACCVVGSSTASTVWTRAVLNELKVGKESRI